MKKFLIAAAIFGLIAPATFTSASADGALVKFNAPVNTSLGIIGSNNSNIQGDIYFNGAQVPETHLPYFASGYNFEQNGSAFHVGHVVSQTNVLNGIPIIDTAEASDLDDVASAPSISSLALGASSQNTDTLMLLGDINIVLIDDINVGHRNRRNDVAALFSQNDFWGEIPTLTPISE